MIGKMFRAPSLLVALAAAFLLVSCGTSSAGSRHQTRTGISESGYPGHPSKDPESPALASSTETAHSNPIPKVPESDDLHVPKTESDKAKHENKK